MFKYHGGKTYLLKYIVPLIDAIPHRTYVEPFGGSGKVLLNKKPSKVEIWNDLDENVYEIWVAVQNRPMQFIRALCAMDYSRENFDTMKTDDKIDRALRAFTLLQQSRNGIMSGSWSDGGTRQRRNMNQSLSAWLSAIESLTEYSRRIKKVHLSNYTYAGVNYCNTPDTLWYLDPPYVHSTRSKVRYERDMNDEQQKEFCTFANSLSGPVIISGYANPIYERYLVDFRRIDIDAYNQGTAGAGKPKKKKVESLWLTDVAYVAYVRVFGSARAHDPNRR